MPLPEQSSTAARRPLGFQITQTWCREHAPEGVRDCYAPLREGDDHGVPYHCDACDAELLPCEHTWSDWGPWFDGGEWRSCSQPHCSEIERR
jgi:hypothetical protein